jgi:hypothetical protein
MTYYVAMDAEITSTAAAVSFYNVEHVSKKCLFEYESGAKAGH